MIENLDLETYIVTVNGERFYLKNDLEAVAEATGRQKTYLRKPTKIKVYKELKDTYDIKSISILDMFPNTVHVETVCSLVKK